MLLSGDHAAVAAWRHEQALRRTAERRPDLLHPSAAATEWEIVPATPGDAGELLTLQRACWVQEALANDSLADIPALHESLDDVAGVDADLVDLGGAQRGPAGRRGARPAGGRPPGTSAG